jgi:hypothetical protein
MLQTVDKRMATACALKEERLHDQLASSEERQDRSTDVAEAGLWTETARDYGQGRSNNESSRRSRDSPSSQESISEGEDHRRWSALGVSKEAPSPCASERSICSKILHVLTLYSKYTTALTLENVYGSHSSHRHHHMRSPSGSQEHNLEHRRVPNTYS